MDLAALAEKARAARAALGPADVRNIRPSMRDFAHYVTTNRNELAVIGELRRTDPDRGALGSPKSIAAFTKSLCDAGCYGVAAGASAPWGGSLDDVRAVSEASSVPVLARMIVLDEQDLYRLRSVGADAAVIYAALHEPARLASLRKAARSMHMEILLEAGDDAALERAIASGCPVIGVSDPALLAKIPSGRVPVLVGRISSTEAIAPFLPHLDALILVEPVMAAADAPGVIAEPFTTLV